MKEYKCKTAFNSPRLGNVNEGDKVTIEEAIGGQMVEAGVLVDIETKPEPVAAKKETKPRKTAKKATK